MDREVKALIFDLDNTLIDTSRAGGLAIRKTSELLKTELGLDDDTISRICDKFKQKLFRECFDPAAGRSIHDVRVGHWEESLRETVGSVPTPSLAAQCYFMWKNSRLEVLSLSPQIRDLLKQLRSRYKLLLLTNGEAQTQREKVQTAKCEEFFDAIVVRGRTCRAETIPLHLHTVFQHARGGGPGLCYGWRLSGHRYSGEL